MEFDTHGWTPAMRAEAIDVIEKLGYRNISLLHPQNDYPFVISTWADGDYGVYSGCTPNPDYATTYDELMSMRNGVHLTIEGVEVYCVGVYSPAESEPPSVEGYDVFDCYIGGVNVTQLICAVCPNLDALALKKYKEI